MGLKFSVLQLRIVGAVAALSLLPALLQWIGLGLESNIIPFEPAHAHTLDKQQLEDALYSALAGGIEHALLEWSCVVLALVGFGFAVVHHQISGHKISLILGCMLLMSGVFDLFHTLAATRLIESNAPPENLIPFTWAASRLAAALLWLGGGWMSLRTLDKNLALTKIQLIGISLLLVMASIGLILWMMHGISMPQTMFPSSLITRPYDVLPLLLFVACCPVFWALHQKSPDTLSFSLFLTLIPLIACQSWMAFGSSHLFDHAFNVAHGLKVLAFLIPLLGFMTELQRTHLALQQMTDDLSQSVARLYQSNQELERFAYVCSHDLQEPVRMVHSFSQLLATKYADQFDSNGRKYLNFIIEGAERAQTMINDLLNLSRINGAQAKLEWVDLNQKCQKVADSLALLEREPPCELEWHNLPTVPGVRSQIYQLFLNLVGNGLKFNHSDRPRVTVSASDEGDYWRIDVADNGIGIAPEHQGQLFQMFSRLHSQSEFPGTGMGLAICKKIVERHKATIAVESRPGHGTRFVIHWPKTMEQI